jgi:hypothetical protein
MPSLRKVRPEMPQRKRAAAGLPVLPCRQRKILGIFSKNLYLLKFK